ncbi:replication initiator protein [Microviridae sp.]|nr:replication initiator protein [Microviridae sp.]
MPCFHPLKGFRSKETTNRGKRKIVFNTQMGHRDLPVTVPCGQCIGCRLERSRQWAIRCYHEAQLYDRNAFITLTYNDQHLPKSGSLNLRHLQLFMKKLRKSQGPRIRFFACGEYGENFRRPHYHVCLFNFEPPDKVLFKQRDGVRLYQSDLIDKIWGQGFTLTGDVTFQSAAYVARYILKKINGPDAENHYENIDPVTGEIFQLKPEFTVMSRRPGIGKDWLNKYRSDVFDHDHVIINGKAVKPPKYYDRQFEIEYPSDYRKIRMRRKWGAKQHAENNTPERLAVRETVQKARLNKLPRTLEENP